MGKIYFLFSLFSFLTVHSFSQGVEDFTNHTATGSYTDSFFIGNGGITWNFVHTRDEGTYPINGKGIILRRGQEPSNLSATLPGGIGSFSVNTRKAFRGNTKRKLELVVNGSVISQFEPNFEPGVDATIKPFVVNNINIPGDVTITLRLFGSNGNQQITLDDMEWTGFTENVTPNLSITSPTEGAEIAPNRPVIIHFKTSNFSIATLGNGSGHLKYTLDSETSNMAYTNEPISLGVLGAGSHTLIMELVDDANNSLSPTVSKLVTFNVAPITQVLDLGALRADVTANGAGAFYEVMSVPTVTFTRTLRNQKYIQDTTAGILIDDFNGAISTGFAIGDGISGLKGKAALNDGLLQLIPISDASLTVSSIIIPEVVTIETLLSKFRDYESELVQINGVTFADAGGTFVPSTAYSTNDGSSIDFITSFGEVDYIGSPIPAAATDLTVIVSQWNGNAQITARSMGDILNTPSFTSGKFEIYPNPTAIGSVKISSANSGNISIEVFDVLGKRVIKPATLQNESLDVSRLKSGVYILKIAQDNAIITKKLIIE